MRFPSPCRKLLANPTLRLLLAGIGVSSLGDDGISTVTIAWLAVRSALLMLSTPLGTALGGPMVGLLCGAATLVVAGIATVLLAGAGALFRREADQDRAGMATPTTT